MLCKMRLPQMLLGWRRCPIPRSASGRRVGPPAKYKLEVLAEYEAADRAGKGALLRRESLYTSLVSEWRKQRDRGALAALSATRGPKPADPVARENQRLVAENTRLQGELDTARKVVRVQGELSALLEQLSVQSADSSAESEPRR